MHPGLAYGALAAIPLHAVTTRDARAWLAKDKRRRFLSVTGFTGAAGQLMPLHNAKGAIRAWALGLGDGRDAFALALAAEKLPAGTYRLGDVPDFCGGANAVLAWTMGGYVFDRYKKKKKPATPKLVVPQGVNGAEIWRIAKYLFLARDLINTPANDMGPAELEAAVRSLARSHDAKVSVVSGAALTKDYPLVAAVGAGSPRAPRMIELAWGRADAPRVTLVGKGVCLIRAVSTSNRPSAC